MPCSFTRAAAPRQAVWLALLMHAAIPRSELVLELQEAGRWPPGAML